MARMANTIRSDPGRPGQASCVQRKSLSVHARFTCAQSVEPLTLAWAALDPDPDPDPDPPEPGATGTLDGCVVAGTVDAVDGRVVAVDATDVDAVTVEVMVTLLVLVNRPELPPEPEAEPVP